MLDVFKNFVETKLTQTELPKLEGQERLKQTAAEPKLELIKNQSLESLQLQNDLKESALNESSETKGRSLTDAERADVKEKTNMSDKTLDKCFIQENGQLTLKCTMESYEGKVHEGSGVEYERKIVKINGLEIEVVVPKFNSVFDTQLPSHSLLAKDAVQFKFCNEQLRDAIQQNPALKSQFTERQLQLIEKGHTPSGFTWHHDAELGKMQLVPSKEHNAPIGGAAHTGGKAIWGGGQEHR